MTKMQNLKPGIQNKRRKREKFYHALNFEHRVLCFEHLNFEFVSNFEFRISDL